MRIKVYTLVRQACFKCDGRGWAHESSLEHEWHTARGDSETLAAAVK